MKKAALLILRLVLLVAFRAECLYGKVVPGSQFCQRQGQCSQWRVKLFRTDAQNDPSDVCQVNSVNKEENGWYAVEYVDMGFEGKCLFSVQLHDNEVFVSDFKQ